VAGGRLTGQRPWAERSQQSRGAWLRFCNGLKDWPAPKSFGAVRWRLDFAPDD